MNAHNMLVHFFHPLVSTNFFKILQTLFVFQWNAPHLCLWIWRSWGTLVMTQLQFFWVVVLLQISQRNREPTWSVIMYSSTDATRESLLPPSHLYFWWRRALFTGHDWKSIWVSCILQHRIAPPLKWSVHHQTSFSLPAGRVSLLGMLLKKFRDGCVPAASWNSFWGSVH